MPLYRVFTNKDDIIETSKVIKRGMNWALGPEIEDFENKLSKYVGCDFCIAFNSGTSAQHAALLAIGIKPNENVIVPSFTFISTANSVLMNGAKPKFADIEEQTARNAVAEAVNSYSMERIRLIDPPSVGFQGANPNHEFATAMKTWSECPELPEPVWPNRPS